MRFLTGGESHGPCLTAIVEGLPAGLPIDIEAINADLSRRRSGHGRGGRMAIEADRIQLLGGVLGGLTTGAPVVLRIENRDWSHWEALWATGLPPLTIPRPGHADYAGMRKYALRDARPILERASARETAARVAVGTLAKLLLREFGGLIGSLVTGIGGVEAELPDAPWEMLLAQAAASPVRCPDPIASERMVAAIESARDAGDSLGGVFIIVALGVPVGLGTHVHWDRRLDARLAAALVSIPAVKGVEIGPAWQNAAHRGTHVHDAFRWDEAGNVMRVTSRAGGLEGGMSNGEPIVLRAAMKPIPTTRSAQESIDLSTRTAARTAYQRSDVCAVPAAAVVGEAMAAWTLAEALRDKLGGDSLQEMKAHWASWRAHD